MIEMDGGREMIIPHIDQLPPVARAAHERAIARSYAVVDAARTSGYYALLAVQRDVYNQLLGEEIDEIERLRRTYNDERVKAAEAKYKQSCAALLEQLERSCQASLHNAARGAYGSD